MKKRVILFLCGALIVLLPIVTNAALDGPAWPAPGGTTYSWTGNSGMAGGQTNTYTGFDNSAYSALYWGADSSYSVGLSFNTDGETSSNPFTGSGEVMTFNLADSNLADGIAVWTGSTVMGWYDDETHADPVWHTAAVQTKFVVTVTDLSGNAIAFMDSSLAGGPASIGALVEVTDPAGFKANMEWYAKLDNDTNWTPALEFFNLSAYDNHGTGDYINYNAQFAGGFYSSPAVPEWPSGILALMGGLTGIRGIIFRRRR